MEDCEILIEKEVQRWERLVKEFQDYLLKVSGENTIEQYIEALKQFIKDKNLDFFDVLAIVGAANDKIRPVIINVIVQLIEKGAIETENYL